MIKILYHEVVSSGMSSKWWPVNGWMGYDANEQNF